MVEIKIILGFNTTRIISIAQMSKYPIEFYWAAAIENLHLCIYWSRKTLKPDPTGVNPEIEDNDEGEIL